MRTAARSFVLSDPETFESRFVKRGEQVTDEQAERVSPHLLVPVETPAAEADAAKAAAAKQAEEDQAAAAAKAAAAKQAEEDQAAAAAKAAADAAPVEPLTDEQVAEVLGHNFDEVNALLDLAPEHASQVLAAEAAGKNRKGIVEGPHAAPTVLPT
jgi:FtsZ-interacting cell division protein ZipA